MAKTNTAVAAAPAAIARRYNDDALHGKDRLAKYIALLTRKAGCTAAELRDAVGAYTKHNSYSLALIAAKNGYRCVTSDDASSGLTPSKDGLKRYGFIVAAAAPKAVKTAAKAVKTTTVKAARKVAPKSPARKRGKPKAGK